MFDQLQNLLWGRGDGPRNSGTDGALLARAHLIGWIVFLGLVFLFIFLGLLKFFVFLLFMYLVSDLIVHGLGDRAPFISRRVVLYLTYLLVTLGSAAGIVFVVVPFVADLPHYAVTLETAATNKAEEAARALGGELTLNVAQLKSRVFEWGRAHLGETFNLAKRAGVNMILFLFAFVINFIVLHQVVAPAKKAELKQESDGDGESAFDLWDFLGAFLADKIIVFYERFREVMAAQVIISAINAVLTLGVLYLFGIPHKLTLTVLVFVFGMLPVVGNLISNTLICVAALLWAGVWQLVAALTFLVVIHKLEYFLNSKIIGDRVKLPVYMTLLALLLGEMLFHISGMILAVPVILFVRHELRRWSSRRPAGAEGEFEP